MEFDTRMTEETKVFIVKAMQLAPFLVDPVAGPAVFNSVAEENNKKFKFENIVEREFLVDSIYDDYKIPVTAFIPKGVSAGSAIVVFFHGAGLNVGSVKTHRNPVAYLADCSNKIWVSVEYRRTPEHRYPKQVHDSISATKWVIDNKTKVFNAAPGTRVGVCGDSPGGYLATSVSAELRSLVSFQILVYPWLDFTGTSEYYREFGRNPIYLLTEEGIKLNVQQFISDTSLSNLKNISPVFSKQLSGLPRCLIVGAELDPLIGDSYTYHKRLQEVDVESELHVVKGVIHGFFFGYMDYKDAFIESASQILNFLRKF